MAYDATSTSLGRDLDSTDVRAGRHSARSTPVTSLEDVFDDPAHGAIGRDRLGVHFAWEGVLILAVAVLGYLFYNNYRSALGGDQLKQLMVMGAVVGILALGASITLRMSVVNLALGPIFMASATYYATQTDRTVIPITISAVVWASVLGAVIAVLVVGFHVPAWLGSLAGAFIPVIWIEQHLSPVSVSNLYDPTKHATYLFGGFVAVSLLAGILGVVRPIRRLVGRYRSVDDPALRRGGVAGAIAASGIVVSSLLAAVAGVVFAALSSVTKEQIVPSTGLQWTGLALGAALVGGVSAYGRRGGVLGTILGVVALVLLRRYADLASWKISVWALAAGVLIAGLVVTRLVETFGRPLSLDEGPEDWSDVGIPGTTSWSTTPSGTVDAWSSLSSHTTTTQSTGTQWDETDRWR